MDAAERNGYTGKDGEAEARRAIRSGLRNGLRSPRALPDFTTSRPAPDRQQPQHRPAPSGPARPQRSQAAAAPGRRAGRWQDMVPDDIRREIEAADTAASDRRRVAIAAHQQALERHGQSATADTAAEVERTRAAAHAAHQAYTHDGRHVTGRHDAAMLRWAAAIAAQREHAAARTSSWPGRQHPRPGQPRSRGRQRGVPGRGPGPCPAAHRPRRCPRSLPRRAVAAAPAADRRPAADPRRQGRARRRRPSAGTSAPRRCPPARPAHASHLGRRPARTAPRPASPAKAVPSTWPRPALAAMRAPARRPARKRVPGTARHATPGPANGEVPKPPWPSSPARSEPQPGPGRWRSAQTARSRLPPRRRANRGDTANAARDDQDPTAEPDARTGGTLASAQSPRRGCHADPPDEQARHEMTARQEPAGRQQPRAAAETEPGGNASPERSRRAICRLARPGSQPGPPAVAARAGLARQPRAAPAARGRQPRSRGSS